VTQHNTAGVRQAQGNHNVNRSPAIAVGSRRKDCESNRKHGKQGGASTWNAQGNGNHADAAVRQSNTADQRQTLGQKGATTNRR
jgi:hypothetical protein